MKPLDTMSDDELNEAVAIEVMGWVLDDKGYWGNKGDASDYRRCEWLPATDHNAALHLATHLATLHHGLWQLQSHRDSDKWTAVFIVGTTEHDTRTYRGRAVGLARAVAECAVAMARCGKEDNSDGT